MEIDKFYSSLIQLNMTMTISEVSALENVLMLARDKLVLTPEEQAVVKTIHCVLLRRGAADAPSQ